MQFKYLTIIDPTLKAKTVSHHCYANGHLISATAETNKQTNKMDGTGSYPEPERQMEWRKEKEKCTKHMKAERDLLVIGKFQ